MLYGPGWWCWGSNDLHRSICFRSQHPTNSPGTQRLAQLSTCQHPRTRCRAAPCMRRARTTYIPSNLSVKHSQPGQNHVQEPADGRNDTRWESTALGLGLRYRPAAQDKVFPCLTHTHTGHQMDPCKHLCTGIPYCVHKVPHHLRLRGYVRRTAMHMCGYWDRSSQPT